MTVVAFTTRQDRHDHRWTDDELKRLMSMWLRGDELDIIAVAFGITPRGVNRQIQRMRANGIPLPRQVEYLVRRRNDRASLEMIANELDRTFYAVQGMVEKLKQDGVLVRQFGQGRRRLWDPERLKSAIAARGLSDAAEILK